ncbi:MAG: hypothetical protein ACRDRP_24455 [Pseudonocardiaceae bacterium]
MTMDPGEENVRTTAVNAVAALLQRGWADDGTLHQHPAERWVNMIVTVGTPPVVVLGSGRDDCWRLADAVLRTGGTYNGKPTELDIAAAREVIDTLTTP